MTVKTLIEQIDDWQTLSVSELVTILNDETVEVRDDRLYTWAGVALVIYPNDPELIKSTLEANGLGWVVHQLGGSGIQLSLPLTQQLLASFAAVPGCNELALVGIHYVSPYVNDGGEGLVTEQLVQAGLDSILLDIQKQTLEDAAVDALQVYREALSVWDGTGDAPVLGGV